MPGPLLLPASRCLLVGISGQAVGSGPQVCCWDFVLQKGRQRGSPAQLLQAPLTCPVGPQRGEIPASSHDPMSLFHLLSTLDGPRSSSPSAPTTCSPYRARWEQSQLLLEGLGEKGRWRPLSIPHTNSPHGLRVEPPLEYISTTLTADRELCCPVPRDIKVRRCIPGSRGGIHVPPPHNESGWGRRVRENSGG